MSRAYDIANELSRCNTNIERGEFVRSVLEERTRGNGHILNLQEMDIEEERGKINYILKGREKSSFMLCAHYDALLLSGQYPTIVPGANDNGSGVGAAIEVFGKLSAIKGFFPQ